MGPGSEHKEKQTDQPDFKAKGISPFAKISSSFLICRIEIIAEI